MDENDKGGGGGLLFPKCFKGIRGDVHGFGGALITMGSSYSVPSVRKQDPTQ
jgi:hypothetical protein